MIIIVTVSCIDSALIFKIHLNVSGLVMDFHQNTVSAAVKDCACFNIIYHLDKFTTSGQPSREMFICTNDT